MILKEEDQELLTKFASTWGLSTWNISYSNNSINVYVYFTFMEDCKSIIIPFKYLCLPVMLF